MKIGVVTDSYMMRLYGYKTYDNFSWQTTNKEYRRKYRLEDFLTLAREVRDRGYKHIEVWEPMLSHLSMPLDDARKARKALTEMGFTSWTYDIGGWRNVHSKERIGGAFEFAKELGTDLLCGAVFEEMLPIVQCEAEKRGMRFGIENHPYPFIESPDELARAAEKYPNIGVNLDVGNMFRAGDDVLATMELLKEKIWHMHIKDTKLGEPGCHAFGEGDTPLPEIIKKCIDDKYEGMLSIEVESPVVNPDSRADLLVSYGYLKGLVLGLGSTID